MHLRILYHDRCFDGSCAAAIFGHFFRQRMDASAEFSLQGLFHQANQLFPDELFAGDENAIVDFKFANNPKLNWWFDHHQSAFLSEEDEQAFGRDESGKKFYDASYRSCTQFIADIARDRFGYDPVAMADLIHWADIIDGARYDCAKTAVEMPAAAMKLTLVLEASKENLTSKVIPLLTEYSLDEIVERPDIRPVFDELYRRHQASIEIIRKRSVNKDGVIYFDLGDTDLAGYNKFIPYYLHPDGTYTVSVLDAGFRTKISVGSSPWAENPKHNLATLCERYGGGGHARVGAISYGPGELDRARQTASEIVAELQT
ncbi:MAG: phosphoesterase [Acidobacteria bacterium]|nr:phosphoesterase [Acidobacteriota bacterium]MDA1234294.1 phosphoesterase [Acidobacteriota bacterium]